MSTNPISLPHLESALDPALQIIDTHVHLWPTGQEHELATPYLLPDLERDVSGGHDLAGVVYVECSANYSTHGPEHLRPVGETIALRAMIDAVAVGAVIRGIVGYVDPSMPDRAEEVLDAHQDAAGALFKGIRIGAAWDPCPDIRKAAHFPPPALLADGGLRRIVRELGRRDLTFDTWVYHHQLDELCAFARSVPSTRIVVDHLAVPIGEFGPYVGCHEEVVSLWHSGLANLARFENVTLKLGGIVAPSFFDPMTDTPLTSQELADLWRVEMSFAIDTFGPDRCTFESNFPVDRTVADYVTLWNAFKRITTGYSATERESLFQGTAVAVYGLGDR